MLTAVGRIFIVLIDKRGHTNVQLTRTVCAVRIAVLWNDSDTAIRTARTVSSGAAC